MPPPPVNAEVPAGLLMSHKLNSPLVDLTLKTCVKAVTETDVIAPATSPAVSATSEDHAFSALMEILAIRN